MLLWHTQNLSKTRTINVYKDSTARSVRSEIQERNLSLAVPVLVSNARVPLVAALLLDQLGNILKAEVTTTVGWIIKGNGEKTTCSGWCGWCKLPSHWDNLKNWKPLPFPVRPITSPGNYQPSEPRPPGHWRPAQQGMAPAQSPASWVFSIVFPNENWRVPGFPFFLDEKSLGPCELPQFSWMFWTSLLSMHVQNILKIENLAQHRSRFLGSLQIFLLKHLKKRHGLSNAISPVPGPCRHRNPVEPLCLNLKDLSKETLQHIIRHYTNNKCAKKKDRCHRILKTWIALLWNFGSYLCMNPIAGSWPSSHPCAVKHATRSPRLNRFESAAMDDPVTNGSHAKMA